MVRGRAAVGQAPLEACYRCRTLPERDETGRHRSRRQFHSESLIFKGSVGRTMTFRTILNRNFGRGDRIRTCDPLLPKQMRYQAAPLPDTGGALDADAAQVYPAEVAISWA
jgi:hypothetical protein